MADACTNCNFLVCVPLCVRINDMLYWSYRIKTCFWMCHSSIIFYAEKSALQESFIDSELTPNVGKKNVPKLKSINVELLQIYNRLQKNGSTQLWLKYCLQLATHVHEHVNHCGWILFVKRILVLRLTNRSIVNCGMDGKFFATFGTTWIQRVSPNGWDFVAENQHVGCLLQPRVSTNATILLECQNMSNYTEAIAHAIQRRSDGEWNSMLFYCMGIGIVTQLNATKCVRIKRERVFKWWSVIYLFLV